MLKILLQIIVFLCVFTNTYGQYEKIKKAFTAKDYEKTIKLCNAKIEDDPRELPPYYYLALAFTEQAMLDTIKLNKPMVLRSIQAIYRIQRRDKDSSFYKAHKDSIEIIHKNAIVAAEIFYRKKQYQNALNIYTQLIKVFSDNKFFFRVSQCQLNLNFYEEFLGTIDTLFYISKEDVKKEQLIKKNSSGSVSSTKNQNILQLVSLTELLFKQQRYESAQRLLERVIKYFDKSQPYLKSEIENHIIKLFSSEKHTYDLWVIWQMWHDIYPDSKTMKDYDKDFTWEILISISKQEEYDYSQLGELIVDYLTNFGSKPELSKIKENAEKKYWQLAMMRLVNEKRKQTQKCGTRTLAAAQPLKWNKKLELSSMVHAKDLSKKGKLSHKGTNNSDPGKRITAAGYGWFVCGENLAINIPEVVDVINFWMTNQEYCSNIMNPEFVEFGAALDNKVWVMNLGDGY